MRDKTIMIILIIGLILLTIGVFISEREIIKINEGIEHDINK